MKSQKLFALIFWTGILITSIFLFNIYKKDSYRRIVAYDDNNPNKKSFNDFIIDTLNFVRDNKTKKDTQIVKILQLNDSTTGDVKTELWVAIDSLGIDKIYPADKWRQILETKNAIIVNSPDQLIRSYDSLTNTIASKICRGCMLRELDTIKKKVPGNVYITHCENSGTYKDLFTYVANVIAINTDYNNNSEHSQQQINKDSIWKNNVDLAVSNLFFSYNDYFSKSKDPLPQVMLFTNFGTHNGKVPISFLYDRFFNQLELAIHKNYLLPRRIYLCLYPPYIKGEPEFDALDKGFELLYKDFSNVQSKYERDWDENKKDWLEIIGISIGMLVLIFSLHFLIKKEYLNYSEIQIRQKLFLITVGQFLIGYGFLKTLEKVPLIRNLFNKIAWEYMYLAFGILAVFLSVIISSAKKISTPNEIKGSQK